MQGLVTKGAHDASTEQAVAGGMGHTESLQEVTAREQVIARIIGGPAGVEFDLCRSFQQCPAGPFVVAGQQQRRNFIAQECGHQREGDGTAMRIVDIFQPRAHPTYPGDITLGDFMLRSCLAGRSIRPLAHVWIMAQRARSVCSPARQPGFALRGDGPPARRLDVGTRSARSAAGGRAHASALVYSCAPKYVEAGAAVFGEALRSGTPVAALVWRDGTCAQAALCERTGVVVQADRRASEDDAVNGLADAIVTAERMDARDVQEVGLARFDPKAHFGLLASGEAC